MYGIMVSYVYKDEIVTILFLLINFSQYYVIFLLAIYQVAPFEEEIFL